MAVYINSSNQLGTNVSSVRFKQDIADLEGVVERLHALRPVSFRYKKDAVNASGNQLAGFEYGLIAEEVAQIFPELVLNDEAGRPYTVRYHLLTPLLLEGYKQQEEEIARLRHLDKEVAALRRTVADQRRRLDNLSKQQESR